MELVVFVNWNSLSADETQCHCGDQPGSFEGCNADLSRIESEVKETAVLIPSIPLVFVFLPWIAICVVDST